MLGDNFGSEQLDVEFKRLIIPSHFRSKLSEDCFDTCHLTKDYDSAIRHSLKYYFGKYLPKYAASMSRTPGHNMAKLIFGIDDDGKIIGFPTRKGVTIEDVNAMVIPALKNVRGVHNGIECQKVKADYFSKVTIELCDVSPPSHIPNLQNIVLAIEAEQAEYDRVMAKYHTAMMRWHEEVEFYSQALEVICRDPARRAVFTQYCKNLRAPHEIIATLESSCEITFELGVTHRKKNQSSMEYFVTEFKDFHLHRLRDLRPRRPNIFRNDDALISLLAGIDIMNGHWKNAHYQIVTINLPMNTDPTKWIEYRRDDQWVSCMRVASARGDPCCERVDC